MRGDSTDIESESLGRVMPDVASERSDAPREGSAVGGSHGSVCKVLAHHDSVRSTTSCQVPVSVDLINAACTLT